jgi:predicted unusual protein kinase regulating ubiquinone biosynthesis (AarF/ABC1/UbiB family)
VNLRSYRRFVAVVRQFLPLLVGYARDRRRFLLFGGPRQVSTETRVARARRLLDSLLTLGPTFIKLGQLLSTRPDVLPPEYIDEFATLQDEVPPAPWTDARSVVEGELGPVAETFEAFDTDAISGASLGQVYLAEYDGRRVAVKVRRPGVKSLVEADLRVIRWTLPVLMWLVGEARAFSLSNLADEFATTIRQEMDYEREAAMLEEIRANFEGDETVAIPPIVKELSGARVLTMEYLHGTKITDLETLDAKGIDRGRVARDLDRAYLKMLLEDGVFHADPHPGNLAVQDDGTVVFYDFGMSGRIGESTQRTIIDFYVAVANRDIDAILDALVRLGTLSPDANMATMAKVMELAIEDARGQRVENWRVNQIVAQVEDTIYEFPFRLPSNLALVLRVATVVEGVCVTLDPDFDFIEVATEFLAERGYREEGVRQILDEARGQVRESALSTIRTPPKIERMLDRFDRDDFYVRADIEDSDDLLALLAKRVVYGMLLSAGVLSTALLYPLPRPTIVAGGFSALVALLLYRTFRRRGIRARPQFTRQAMRERREE